MCSAVDKDTKSATYLDRAVLPARLQPQYPESLRDDHALLAIVGGRNALKQLEALKSSRAAGSLVGDHAADGPVENLGRCAVVEGAGFFGVDNVAFVEEVVVAQLRNQCKSSCEMRPNSVNWYVTHLVTEEAARDVNLLAPHNDNLLAVQNLLGDNRGQPAKKMALAINDDGA